MWYKGLFIKYWKNSNFSKPHVQNLRIKFSLPFSSAIGPFYSQTEQHHFAGFNSTLDTC